MKILFVTPHLSTGGLPQYLYWKCKEKSKEHDVYVVEYSCISKDFVVQRNNIINLVGYNRFYSLEGNDYKKTDELIKIIYNIKPEIIHFEEIPETWAPDYLLEKIYVDKRFYWIHETSHGSWIGPETKKFLPDKFIFVTPYQKQQFKDLKVPIEILEYPIIKKERPDRNESLKKLNLDTSYKHILHVGLFAPHKQQDKIFKIAKKLQNYNVLFHFVGNMADNFSEYWKPLVDNKPGNCIIWGEKNNVNDFYCSMDMLIFPSNKETNPLVPKEALSWNMPILMKKLPVYLNMYDNEPLVEFMSDLDKNIDYIKDKLNLSKMFKKKKTKFFEEPDIHVHFVKGPTVEIKNGENDKEYLVSFIDKKTNKILYSQIIKTNNWVKCNREWFTEWEITVEDIETKKIIYKNNFNPKNKRFFITLDSKSLGDTIAWIPYVEEFRKKYNADIVCSTFWNKLFKKDYPKINFVKPGSTQYNLYGMFRMGVTLPHNYNRNPINGFSIPLSKVASDILGLRYDENLKADISVSEPKK